MNKRISIILLFFINSLITLSGIAFICYSFYTKFTFKVLNTNIPGTLLGFSILYLCFKNYRSVYKLKKQISVSNVNFSWNNFKEKNYNVKRKNANCFKRA